MYQATADDKEPRGHDYQQAQGLWLLGYRNNEFCTGGTHWKERLLVIPSRRRRKHQHEHYCTLRVFEAFRLTRDRLLNDIERGY